MRPTLLATLAVIAVSCQTPEPSSQIDPGDLRTIVDRALRRVDVTPKSFPQVEVCPVAESAVVAYQQSVDLSDVERDKILSLVENVLNSGREVHIVSLTLARRRSPATRPMWAAKLVFVGYKGDGAPRHLPGMEAVRDLDTVLETARKGDRSFEVRNVNLSFRVRESSKLEREGTVKLISRERYGEELTSIFRDHSTFWQSRVSEHTRNGNVYTSSSLTPRDGVLRALK